MSEAYDPIVDEILKETEWLENAPPGAEFAHSFLDIPVHKTIGALGHILRKPLPIVRHVFPGISGTQRHLFASRINSGTILWHKQSDLSVPAELSRHFRIPVHWISIYEETRCWAYCRFLNGNVDVLVIDPESYWRDNILRGEDLVGKGERQYQTLDKFMLFIKKWYEPADKIWNYQRWCDSRQSEIPQFRHTSINACIEIRYTPTVSQLTGIGNWDAKFLSQLKSAFEESSAL